MIDESGWEFDEIVLKTGTVIYANRRILGICPAGRMTSGSPITGGYDDVVHLNEYSVDDSVYIPKYTKCELYEIADIAIARWNQFKRDVVNGVHKTKPDAITSKESS